MLVLQEGTEGNRAVSLKGFTEGNRGKEGGGGPGWMLVLQERTEENRADALHFFTGGNRGEQSHSYAFFSQKETKENEADSLLPSHLLPSLRSLL